MVIIRKAKDIRFYFNVHCNLVKYNDKVIEEGELYRVIREQSLWQSSIWGKEWRMRWNLSGEEPGKSWLGWSDSMWESPKLKKHPRESGEQKNARAAKEYWSKGKTYEAELEKSKDQMQKDLTATVKRVCFKCKMTWSDRHF